jgi:hypothetical protein
MAFTEVDFTYNGATVFRVAATFHEIYEGFYILYNGTSNLQPVAVVPVASGFKLVESPTPAPPLPPGPPLSDMTPWWLFNGVTPIGAARAFGVDATSQPGTIVLSAKPVPPATGGQTLSTFTHQGDIAIFRAPFLILPQPPVPIE